MSPLPSSTDHVVAAVLRGEPGSLDDLNQCALADILSVTDRHGVTGLLWRRVGRRSTVPAAWAQMLEARVSAAAALGAVRRLAAMRALDALGDAAIDVLVLKGDALANSLYPASYLRLRGQTDLLVKQDDVQRASKLLVTLGYRPLPMVSRIAAHAQRFESTDGNAGHGIDLHWAICGRPMFASMGSFEELAIGSRPIPALGEHARTPSLVWSLFLACIHHVAHEDGDRLIWLWDIGLLAERLSAGEWARFWSLVARHEAVMVCRHALSVSTERTGLDREVWAQSEPQAPWFAHEPSAAFLRGPKTRLRIMVLDTRAVRGVAAKARVVMGQLFPDPDYMREMSGATTTRTLAAAYARRAASGIWRALWPASRKPA